MYGNTLHMISTIVITQTSTQKRTHAQEYHASLSPDSRVRMLENNAEAQRKHQESLSPDTKTCIQESDTAAHQKCRQSLSPDSKACIQETDTAACQKRQESLPPNTKARIQECNTTVHQKQQEKFMTEEEKKIEAQIKEYARILPSAIDIDQTTVEFLRINFYKFPTLVGGPVLKLAK